MKIRLNGPTCGHCKRPLIVTAEGKCLCCGHPQKGQ